MMMADTFMDISFSKNVVEAEVLPLPLGKEQTARHGLTANIRAEDEKAFRLERPWFRSEVKSDARAGADRKTFRSQRDVERRC
jgi:hypothetical protein